MVVFAWAMFFIFGKTYDAVMLCAGGIGFSMGSTANGLANMQLLPRNTVRARGVAHH